VTLAEPLEPFVTDPDGSVLLLDFDGSIAPIVDDPSTAAPLPAMVDVLTALAPALGRVAVVSGRTVEFLAGALAVPGVELVGLYGLEREVDGRTAVDPRAAPWIGPIAAAAAEAERTLPDLFVERKGDLCVTIHYRTAPARADAVRAVAADLAARYGIDAPARGRMAVELRPPIAVDKGTATRELVAGARAAAFAGDDAGDLPAFAALRTLAADGTLDHGVCIGVSSPEAPPGILAADLVVDGPVALAALLRDLVDAISARAG
jgi:trehalose 6-phosphate phosphatase